jgi:hypothetical protein
LRRAAIAIALLAGCSETRTVEIGFGAGERTPIGFRCRDEQGRFIIQRAVENRTLRFSLLVDFVGLGGVPSCRASDIALFCEEHGCAPLSTPGRVCIPFERQLAGADNPIIVIGELLRGLDGQLVTDDAPDEPVLIRAIATAQTCEEVAGVTALDPERLVGCALSCPVQLDGVEGEVTLELPTLSDTCAPGVVVCASASLGRP